MKVLLINPWGINNDEYYTAGFIAGMNQLVKISFASNYYYKGISPNGNNYRFFFKESEIMKPSVKRKLIRGCEYILAWHKILNLVQSERFDVIHIHWLLMYYIDLRYIKKLKKHCRKLILTAHNVLPHINGDDSLNILRKVYSEFDIILVHGESIKTEFVCYYPELANKVRIQFHGEYYGMSKRCCEESDKRVACLNKKKIKFDKTFIIFGSQFFNKGTDRIANLWIKEKMFDNNQLIIAGKINKNYKELLECINLLKQKNNVVIFDYYVDNDLLNYCINISDAVIIPYRHASMSGVLHTAAAFYKPVICTKTGALEEYLVDGQDSFVCENTDKDICLCLKKVLNISNSKLLEMGRVLHENVQKKYSWDVITKKLYEKVYCDNLMIKQ